MITNILGQKIKSAILTQDNSILVEDLQRGVYLYQLYNEEGLVQFGRFVKE